MDDIYLDLIVCESNRSALRWGSPHWQLHNAYPLSRHELDALAYDARCKEFKFRGFKVSEQKNHHPYSPVC